MNFRECVIDCIAQGEVVQSFNRLHDAPMTEDLVARLNATDSGQLPLTDLDDSQQEMLACFILFVHRHVWRKVKFAQHRVTRISAEGLLLDLSRLEQVSSQLGPLQD
jgi:hypothetical protein